MTLPATMKVLGLVLGLVLIVLMEILSEISVFVVVRLSVHSKAQSYGEVVQSALGRVGRILSKICIIVNTAGILLVYLIIMRDVLSGSIRHIGVFDKLLGNGMWDHRKLLILVILVLFLTPLCAVDKIDSLTSTSALFVPLAIVFVVVTFTVAIIKLVEGKIEPPRMTPDFGSKKAILELLMSNACVYHFNIQQIYNELEGRSPHKLNRVSRITTVICVLVYVSTAISGYLLFGKDTDADVLTNFDKDLGIRFSSALNYIVRIGYVLHLILVFPVIHFSLRQTVDAMIFEGSVPLRENRKRCPVLIVVLGMIYFGPTMILNIWTAFKFTRATTPVSLRFTFPALIALRLSKEGINLSCGEKFLSWFMLILPTIVALLGFLAMFIASTPNLSNLPV